MLYFWNSYYNTDSEIYYAVFPLASCMEAVQAASLEADMYWHCTAFAVQYKHFIFT